MYSRRSVLKEGALATSALALGGTAASGRAVAGIGDGRVGHYHLNNLNYDRNRGEKVAEHVHDASPERNHGVNHGAEVVKDGAVGNSFEFGPTTFVQIDDDESLEVSSVTVAAWVWRDGTKSHEYIYDGRGHNYLIKERDNTEKPEFYVRIDGSWKTVTAPDPLPNQTWTHVAGVYDSTSPNDSLRLYINGEDSGSKDVVGVIETSKTSTDLLTSRIGDTVWNVSDSDESGGYSFQGRIDEVRVYDRALDKHEIQDLVDMKD